MKMSVAQTRHSRKQTTTTAMLFSVGWILIGVCRLTQSFTPSSLGRKHHIFMVRPAVSLFSEVDGSSVGGSTTITAVEAAAGEVNILSDEPANGEAGVVESSAEQDVSDT